MAFKTGGFKTRYINECRYMRDGYTKRNDFNHSHLMLVARKGIELGLKATQKGE